MSPAMQEISTARARANQLRWWWSRRLGWLGWLAALLLLAAALLKWAVLPSIASAQRELLHGQVARLDLAGKALNSGLAQRDPRDMLRLSFPPVSQRGESIAVLLDLLQQGQVAADSADYRAEDLEPGLVRLRMSLPVSGAYPAIRKLAGSILEALPYAALDGLTLERPAASGERLSGQMRLSLYFRQESP